MMRYYGMAGISFYRIDKFLFTGDAQVGGYKPSKKQFRNVADQAGYVCECRRYR